MPIIERFYEEIEFVMAALGYNLFSSHQTDSNGAIYHTTRRGVVAFGRYFGEKFELLPDSMIDIGTSANLQSHEGRRRDMIAAGEISEGKDGKHYLKVNMKFESPSGASDFVLGGSTNGWIEWKDYNNITLDELFRKVAPSDQPKETKRKGL